MENSEPLRHQTISSVVALQPEEVATAAIDHWERLANQIISVIGEGGFNSLYARSLFLTRSTFPWLAAGAQSAPTDHRFADLKMSFEGQTTAQVSEANGLLLITFTNILAALIGEPLTTRLLRSAWPNEAQDRASKEFSHEQ